jgi:hypothetical protein
VQVSKLAALVLGFCVWCVTPAGALNFEYSDGTKFTGDIVMGTPSYIQVRVNGGYTNLDWGKLTQETLAELKEHAATNTSSTIKRLEPLIQPYIIVTDEERLAKTEVPIKKDYEKLERPAKSSVIGGLFKSPVGLVCLLLLFAANIYAGYEIAVIRAYPPLMVCGIAAVAPVIGPVVLLCLPTRLPGQHGEEHHEEEAAPADSHSAGHAAPAAGETPEGGHAAPAAAAPASAKLPQTQVFKRGQFTFNRRFIETKFSSFFPAIRRGDDKDLVLVIKTTRGEFIANRISRIASNDMHAEVHRGGASQEVQIPFAEIQEIHLKHKDA